MTKQGGRLCFETTFLLQESDELKVFHHPKCLQPSALMSGVKQKRIFVQRLWLSSFHLTRISCLSFSFKSCRYICQNVLFGTSVCIFNRAPVVLYIIPSLSFLSQRTGSRNFPLTWARLSFHGIATQTYLTSSSPTLSF
jgi:hypothetical protein